jgi:monoamine oxidase
MLKILTTCLFLYLSLCAPIHEVIIIGAGASGIAASLTLTKQKVPHLMLEARDRIGGRIQSGFFENTRVDLGATFVHKPNKTNPIVDIMKELNLTAIPARYNE